MAKGRRGIPAGEIRVSGRRLPLPAMSVRRAVATVLAAEHRTADISVTFVGRNTIRELNKRWLGHDVPTDVIAFPLSAPGGRLSGDIYVCTWQAARNAKLHGVSLREELLRLVVHGTLHVLGYDHPLDTKRLISPMWVRQEKYVEGLR